MLNQPIATSGANELNLTQADSGSSAALSKDEEGHSVFSFKLKVAGGWEMPVALVVKGVAQQ